jgi:hypothetical protein
MTVETASCITALATATLTTIALVTACIAISEYKQNGRRDKARWLTDLFGQFYNPEHYRGVYLAFDGQDPSRLQALARIIAERAEAHSDSASEWDLTRYLNFFELVATLWKRHQLTIDDVALLFKYPLKRLAAQRGIVGYLKQYDYDALAELLSKFPEA